ncbi:phage tail tape measure protein [Brevundimonas faecalis]|uniref:phage tail tape measure protein n=1 Tax=Brevundimonas faecalis TaxID=947378 RepID=UPI00360A7C49
MSAATIGALKVVLGLDVADFDGGLKAAQKELRKAGREFQKIGREIGDIGKSMSMSLTLPIIGLGVAVTKTAGDFEAAMNRVSISTGAAGKQFEQLSDLAREIGRETVFSASTAADAIDMLAKSGVSVEDILAGAARAAVDLAAAAGSELEPAAAAITDSMAQFKITAAELPRVVNGITGAVNESKLDFADFTLAIGQAGGVAANLGVSFEDFNTVLAGISPLFTSGSDAGTSFKTFLQRMIPTSKAARDAMAEYGLTFHDAAGKMKPMADIAQMLKDKLAGLNDATRTKVLTEIFGTDSIKVAIALMDQGAAGLDKIAAKIAATDAAAQSAKRMEGLNGQLEQLGGAFEELAIAIGESGLLNTITGVVSAIAGVAERLAGANPVLLQVGVAFAAVAAAIGPVLIVVGSLISAVGTITAALGGAGLLATLGALAPPLLAVGAAVAVAVAVFMKFKDYVIPVLQKLWEVAKATLGPALGDLFKAVTPLLTGLSAAFDKALNSEVGQTLLKFWQAYSMVFGEVAIRALTVFVRMITTGFQLVGDALSVLGDLLTGDFSGAWEGTKRLVSNLIENLKKAFNDLVPFAVDAIRRMVQGVAVWMQGRLFDVLRSVIDKVKGVSDAFFKLYDAVVGHSYVPDMVLEIGEWMKRLDQNMVGQARKTTDQTARAFEDVRQRANAAMEGLLTDSERAWRDHAKKVKDLQDGIAQGGPDAAVYKIGLERENAAWDARDLKPATTPEPLGDVSDLPGVKVLNDTWARIQQQIYDSREKFADAFASGIEAALRGDWQGVLRSVFGDVMNDVFRDAGRSFYDLIRRAGSGGGDGGGVNWGGIISNVGSWFSKLPGFSTGGSFKVGGSGGVDSKLVSMRLTPGEMVDVRRPGQDAGPWGGMRVVVDVNDDRFNAYVDDRAGPIAESASVRMGRTVLEASRRSMPGLQQSQRRMGTP